MEKNTFLYKNEYSTVRKHLICILLNALIHQLLLVYDSILNCLIYRHLISA